MDRFAVEYTPVRYPFYGVQNRVSGVGYNMTRALSTLGHEARLVSLIGGDQPGRVVRDTLGSGGLSDRFVVEAGDQTAQSVILYTHEGQRQIHIDLKEIQERSYPSIRLQEAAYGCDALVLCNINFPRLFLDEGRSRGALVVTDVHAVDDIDDDYNAEFMSAADILVICHECLPLHPKE